MDILLVLAAWPVASDDGTPATAAGVPSASDLLTYTV